MLKRSLLFRNYVAPLLCLALLVGLNQHSKAESQKPSHSRLLGGIHAGYAGDRFGVIPAGLSYCTATLVGPREVLTAASCFDNHVSSEFVFQGEVYRIAQIFPHFSYNKFDSVFKKAPYDVAVVILETDPPRARPIAILENLALQKGESFAVFGFGYHETPFEANYYTDLLHNIKLGEFRLSQRFDGVFESNYTEKSTGLCLGDMGAGALIEKGGDLVVAGVASYSTFPTDENGFCRVDYGGKTGFVDLQAPLVKTFLDRFPTLKRYRYVPPTPVPTPVAAQPAPTAPPAPTAVPTPVPAVITLTAGQERELLGIVRKITKLRKDCGKLNERSRGAKIRRLSMALDTVVSSTSGSIQSELLNALFDLEEAMDAVSAPAARRALGRTLAAIRAVF